MSNSIADLVCANRDTLGAALDRLIPPVEALPGAGGMGLAAEIERIGQMDSRFYAALECVLDALSRSGEPFTALSHSRQTAVLAGVEKSLPRAFATFIELAYLAYYSDERVHQRIAWRSGPLQPEGFFLAPFDPVVLEKIRLRPPFWRRA